MQEKKPMLAIAEAIRAATDRRFKRDLELAQFSPSRGGLAEGFWRWRAG